MILPLSVDLGISSAWDEAVHKPTQGPVGGALTALFDCNNNKPRPLHGAAIKLRSACVSLRLLWVSHNPRTS